MKEELTNYSQNDRLVRSFGRIKSRKLSDHKKLILEKLFPLYEIKNFDLSTQENCLEIGFGFGDFLFEQAKKNPKRKFFGCEPHINGIVNLLSKLQQEPLQNLKISKEDVRILIKNFPDNFFDKIYILFPDPWPKLKHFKRRLIRKNFLDETIAPKVKSLATITIATDHHSYKTWILSEILHSKKFSWLVKSKKDWQNFPDSWVETKYQKKATKEGRKSAIFNLIRNV